MKKKCILETKGYTFSFYLKRSNSNKEGAYLIVEFNLDLSLGKTLLRSPATFISFKDLQRLIVYFEDYVSSLYKTLFYESSTFVTYALNFKIQALSGKFDPSNEKSNFGIHCMVNMGVAQNKIGSTYLGGESVVTFRNIQKFILSLQAVINEFSNSQ